MCVCVYVCVCSCMYMRAANQIPCKINCPLSAGSVQPLFEIHGGILSEGPASISQSVSLYRPAEKRLKDETSQ